MVRPKCDKNLGPCPKYEAFKPEGCTQNIEEIEIEREEAEALRLKNLLGLGQVAAAKKMGISQSTFQRLLSSAYKKVSLGLIEGKIIKLNKNK